MALSNWDLLAIGKDGKSCDGEIKGKFASVEIYKNWAYIMSPKMWTKESSFTKPTIASVSSGELTIAGLSISAIRHSLQSSIFIFVDASFYGKNRRKYPNYFAGIGCYGYKNRLEEFLKYKGIDSEYDDAIKGSRNYRNGPNGETIHVKDFVEYVALFKDHKKVIEVEIDPEFGDFEPFVGVMPETLEAFKTWMLTEIHGENKYDKHFNKWLSSINWDELQRFNQGDAFFIGSDAASTAVGEQENDTILMNALKTKE